jgi:hypothetical protein
MLTIILIIICLSLVSCLFFSFAFFVFFLCCLYVIDLCTSARRTNELDRKREALEVRLAKRDGSSSSSSNASSRGKEEKEKEKLREQLENVLSESRLKENTLAHSIEQKEQELLLVQDMLKQQTLLHQKTVQEMKKQFQQVASQLNIDL